VLVALQRPDLRGRAFNLAQPSTLTWNEYFVRFAKALGAVPVRRIGRRRLALETRLAAPPLKIAELLWAAARQDPRRLPSALPPSLLGTLRQELRLDGRRAEQHLGIRWTGLDAGLDVAARWYARR
jgi:hypothetical protein